MPKRGVDRRELGVVRRLARPGDVGDRWQERVLDERPHGDVGAHALGTPRDVRLPLGVGPPHIRAPQRHPAALQRVDRAADAGVVDPEQAQRRRVDLRVEARRDEALGLLGEDAGRVAPVRRLALKHGRREALQARVVRGHEDDAGHERCAAGARRRRASSGPAGRRRGRARALRRGTGQRGRARSSCANVSASAASVEDDVADGRTRAVERQPVVVGREADVRAVREDGAADLGEVVVLVGQPEDRHGRAARLGLDLSARRTAVSAL